MQIQILPQGISLHERALGVFLNSLVAQAAPVAFLLFTRFRQTKCGIF